jgi:hypothetical protein
MGTFIPTVIRSQQIKPFRRTKRFLARYFHEGAWYAVDVYANSFAEAEVICKAHSLQLDGQHVMTIPMNPVEQEKARTV